MRGPMTGSARQCTSSKPEPDCPVPDCAAPPSDQWKAEKKSLRGFATTVVAKSVSNKTQPLGLRAGCHFQNLEAVIARLLVESGIDQFAAQQIKRRLVVEPDVAERIGQDLGHPDQAGLDVADEEQLHGAEQQAADP